MKITVISDTHMPRKGKFIPKQVLKSIEKTDYLIHAGDFTSPDLINYFKKLTRFEGVAGNNDGIEIIMKLGKRKIINLNGYKIGIFHGEGLHSNTIQRVKHEFSNEKVDIVIFGHTHKPYKMYEDGILYFNPGSPTDKRRNPNYSFGEITLDKKIKADTFYF